MNAIFGALLSLTGSVLVVELLVSSDYRWLWVPAVLLCLGMFMLLRNRRDDEAELHHNDSSCATCRGAGTIYSAEWNDWRRSGPVHTIRELCPACQGVS